MRALGRKLPLRIEVGILAKFIGKHGYSAFIFVADELYLFYILVLNHLLYLRPFNLGRLYAAVVEKHPPYSHQEQYVDPRKIYSYCATFIVVGVSLF
jgi:hypothetical protein